MSAFRNSREKARLRAMNEELAYKSRQDSIDAADGHARGTNIPRNDQGRPRIPWRRPQALADAQRRLDWSGPREREQENQLLTTGMLVMGAVYFETGKADVSINSKPYLDMLSKMLVKYPKLQIEVAGHTDNVGSEAYNQGLSERRAAAVRANLIEEAPELGGRLTANGYGESMAKADNTSAEGRKLNRRTELQVLNKDALREYNEPSCRRAVPRRRLRVARVVPVTPSRIPPHPALCASVAPMTHATGVPERPDRFLRDEIGSGDRNRIPDPPDRGRSTPRVRMDRERPGKPGLSACAAARMPVAVRNRKDVFGMQMRQCTARSAGAGIRRSEHDRKKPNAFFAIRRWRPYPSPDPSPASTPPGPRPGK